MFEFIPHSGERTAGAEIPAIHTNPAPEKDGNEVRPTAGQEHYHQVGFGNLYQVVDP